ncbi:MAG: hypothetical protein LBV67_11215, partial [Streptococcaceae bacterium]|nr:hypothetical protein [Streptococcaceae bacterium]
GKPVLIVYQGQLARALENREGTEGETARTEGDISRAFESELISPNIKRALARYAKGKAVRF